MDGRHGFLGEGGGVEFFRGVTPDEGEGGAGYDEAGAETQPEADGSVVEAEAEEVADGRGR